MPRPLLPAALWILAACTTVVVQYGHVELANCATARCEELRETPLQLIQLKGAHNSINRDESLVEQLQWSADRPYESGCRAIELDLVQKTVPEGPDAPWDFVVQHGIDFLTDDKRPFGACLSDLQKWASEHPDHDLVIVHLDLKNHTLEGDDAQFPRKLDERLTEYLTPAQLYTPGDLLNAAKANSDATLRDALGNGWPTLGALTGRFLFVISGDERNDAVHRRKITYATTHPCERAAFVDVDLRLPDDRWRDELELGHRVVLNLTFRGEWREAAAWAAARNLLTRIWVANDADEFRAALDAGVNVVSTDKVRGHEWARVGTALPFRRREVDGRVAVDR